MLASWGRHASSKKTAATQSFPWLPWGCEPLCPDLFIFQKPKIWILKNPELMGENAFGALWSSRCSCLAAKPCGQGAAPRNTPLLLLCPENVTGSSCCAILLGRTVVCVNEEMFEEGCEGRKELSQCEEEIQPGTLGLKKKGEWGRRRPCQCQPRAHHSDASASLVFPIC